MVALLHRQPAAGHPNRPHRVPLHLVPDARLVAIGGAPTSGFGTIAGSASVGTVRPRLELVSGADESLRPSAGMVVMVALAVFGLFGAVRVLQGSTASVSEPERATSALVSPADGDQVVVAGPGDSLWSIAVGLFPQEDPRPTVAALIEANGGDSIEIGQQIVIPSRLLD